jgi:hypothetical protein
MKLQISMLILVFAIVSCKSETTKQAEALKQKEDSAKLMINENLNSRFTGYEIVEIQKDSSFIYDAQNTLARLGLIVSENNLEIIRTISDFELRKLKVKGVQVSQHIDSAYEDSEDRLQAFEKREFEKIEPCYYVKYRIFDGANKIEKEEYFLIREYGDNQKEVLRSPVVWEEFMREEDYDKLIDNVLKFYRDVLDYRYKYTSKF